MRTTVLPETALHQRLPSRAPSCPRFAHHAQGTWGPEAERLPPAPLNSHAKEKEEVRKDLRPGLLRSNYRDRGWDPDHGLPYTDTLEHLGFDAADADLGDLVAERPRLGRPLPVGALPYTLEDWRLNRRPRGVAGAAGKGPTARPSC